MQPYLMTKTACRYVMVHSANIEKERSIASQPHPGDLVFFNLQIGIKRSRVVQVGILAVHCFNKLFNYHIDIVPWVIVCAKSM